MKISIIIPVYGVENYIEACLQSVAIQNANCEVECILVDDCGHDNSITIARNFISKYIGNIDFKIVERQRNGGLSEARNSGIEAATGDYLFFLDSDDELTPHAINVLAEASSRLNCDLIIADYYTRGAKMHYPHSILPQDYIYYQPDIYKKYVHATWYCMACAKLYRREFILRENLRFYLGILHEDELWTFQCAARARSMSTIYDVCYVYNIRDNSITTSSSNDLKRVLDSGTILREIFKEIKKRNLKYSKALNRFLAFRIWSLFTRAEKILPYRDCLNLYCEFRKIYPASFGRTALTCSMHLAQQFYNLHRMLPPRLGFKLFMNKLHHKTY